MCLHQLNVFKKESKLGWAEWKMEHCLGKKKKMEATCLLQDSRHLKMDCVERHKPFWKSLLKAPAVCGNWDQLLKKRPKHPEELCFLHHPFTVLPCMCFLPSISCNYTPHFFPMFFSSVLIS